MTKLKNALVGTAAIAAMVVSATPATARDRWDRHHDGIGAGEIIAGAVVLGGLAAILSSGNDRDRYDDGRYGYDSGRGSRQAVSRCIAAAERDAGRYGRADVTQVRDIQHTRYGYRVTGTLRTDDDRRGYGGWDRYDGDDDYRRGDRYDYRRGGYGRYDRGSFTCTVERGRVVDLDYRGL